MPTCLRSKDVSIRITSCPPYYCRAKVSGKARPTKNRLRNNAIGTELFGDCKNGIGNLKKRLPLSCRGRGRTGIVNPTLAVDCFA